MGNEKEDTALSTFQSFALTRTLRLGSHHTPLNHQPPAQGQLHVSVSGISQRDNDLELISA
jgi:hypothetical protein